jgi:UDP-3-O-[3-hydroxymyristoyl] glucosamine N-acyltransferase
LTWSLEELAARVGGEVVGDRRRRIERIRTLEAAGPDDLSFLTHPKYLDAARASAAGALLVGRRIDGIVAPQIVVGDPSTALAALLAWLHPEPATAPGIHTSAIVGEGCRIDPSASIGAYAVLGEQVEVGAEAVIHPHVVVGDGCRVGAGATLHPHVVLYRRTVVGERTVVHAGAVLGADGFGYAEAAGAGPVKIPQVGDVALGDDVEIGALTAVDRALLATTRVGDGTKIDNLVQVGHNVEIGRGAIVCGQSGLAGSAKVGDGVIIAAQSGVAGHLTMGARSRLASKSAAYRSVPPGETVAGTPAVPIAVWRRQQALLSRLAELWRRLRRLERPDAARENGEDRG